MSKSRSNIRQGVARNATLAASLIGLSLIAAMPASAATRTWIGANTSWYDTNNWSGGSVPTNGDVIHLDGVVQFGGKSFTSTNGVLIFTNTLDMLHTFFVTPAEKGTIFKGR